MTIAGGPPVAGWRRRWADQEDGRRQRAYRLARTAWEQAAAEHARAVDLATGFRAAESRALDPALGLNRGEQVYWSADGAGMVEAGMVPGLRAPDHRQASTLAGPDLAPPVPLVPTDIGRLLVTSRRVIFLGRYRREWTISRMTGLVHTTAGQTLMTVSNRKRASGVVPPAGSVTGFRLHLALALADSAGERDELIALLRERARAHRRAEPPAPSPVGPDAAPASAWFTGGRLVAAVVAPALVVLICCLGTVLAMTAPEPETAADVAAGDSTPSARAPAGARPEPRGAPSPSPSPDRTPGPTATAEAGGEGEQTGGVRAPTGDCAAYVASEGWCEDGTGDYDCEGGTGNGPGYAPSGVELVAPGEDPFGLDDDGDGEGCERAAAPAPPAPPPPPSGDDPRFGTCAEARSAGYGPYQSGVDPEYSWYQDRDNDGVVCE